MLLDACLDNRFWGEAVLTAAYLQNRMTSRSIDKTPVELFIGEKPDLSHIRVFGSKVYSMVPRQKRRKWHDKAEEGVLVGYDGNTKGYRILNLKTNRVWIARSVRIIEHEDKQPGHHQALQEEGASSDIARPPKTIEYEMSEQNEVCESSESEEESEEEIDDENYETPDDTTPQVCQRRVSQRTTKGVPLQRLTYKVQENSVQEPKSWHEMLELPSRERELWIKAAEEEIKSLNDHQIWELTDLPPGKKVTTCKWVFKAKLNGEGRIYTHKARLVARGFSQAYGEDYDETFAPVVKHETIRVLLCIAAQKGLHVRHLDVKSAYLNGQLEEEIFLEQPPGFQKSGQESKVLRLRKSLYGLKQSARAWNKRATEALAQIGFRPGKAEHCLYTRKERNGTTTYVLLYVDDLLVAGTSTKITEEVSRDLQEYFDIKDLGDVNHYLGVQIKRQADGSSLLNQKGKITKILEEYGLLEPKPAATPMETNFLNSRSDDSAKIPNNNKYRKAIGSLLYIATVSRPDIATAVGILCRRVEKPTKRDWEAVKRVMRYLAFTINKSLQLSSTDTMELECFVDSDWAGDKTDRKSTSGYVFCLGKGTVAWSSRKQTSVATSSTEAEYIAASHASKEVLWFRQLLKDMNIPRKGPTKINEDNQGCIRLIESDRCGARTKHIDICHHKIRDLREKKIIDVCYCPTEAMVADLLTKPLAKERFQELVNQLGVK